MKSKQDNKSFLGFFILTSLIVFYGLVKSKFLSLPLHNDEMNHMDGVRRIIEHDFFPFTEWWSYHPPLVYELVAVIVSFFQKHVWIAISRMVIGVFGIFTILCTYALGKKLFNREVGVLSAILLTFLPLFQAQTSLIHLDIPLTFFFLASFYFYLEKKWWLYLLFATFTVLTKETGVMVIFLLGLFDFLVRQRSSMVQRLRWLVFLNLPQLAFLVWMIFNKKYLGWFLWPYHIQFLTADRPYKTLHSLIQLGTASFWDIGVWILSLGIGLGIIFLLVRQKAGRVVFKKEFIYVFILALSLGLFFYGTGTYLPRYLLLVFPLIVIFFAALVSYGLSKRIWAKIVVTAVVMLVFLMNWFHGAEDIIHWAGERNYGYINIVGNYQQVADFVNQNFPEEKTVAPYPIDVVLEWALAGYVDDDQAREVDSLESVSLTDFRGLVIVPNLFVRDKSWGLVERHEKARLVKVIKTRGVETKIFAFDE